MIFIGGVQSKITHLEAEDGSCPSCGRQTLSWQRMDQYISLFFVPIFPFKRGEPYLGCSSCNRTFRQQTPPPPPCEETFKIQCASCGKSLEQGFAFCPHCGKAMK